jgi:nicotinamide mononucleotide adenylyltransferase
MHDPKPPEPRFDAVATVGRFQGGPHLAHRDLFEYAARHVRIGGTLVVFIGSAHCHREPLNPFTWVERQRFLAPVLKRICDNNGIRYRIIPLRDTVDNSSWADALLKELLRVAEAESLAICDANKNGAASNYAEWFNGRLTYIPFAIRDGISATPYRQAFLRTGKVPEKYRKHICPETLTALDEWKNSHPAELQWLREELQSYRCPSQRARQVILCMGHVLMFERLLPPGRQQFHLPFVQSSVSSVSQQEEPKVYEPSELRTDPNDPNVRKIHHWTSKVLGTDVQFWEFFVQANGQSQEAFKADRLLPALTRDYEKVLRPAWIHLQNLPETPLFGQTLFYLESALGRIPVKIPDAALCV